MLSIYAVQFVITQQREMRISPLFIDVPDLHSVFDIKLIDLITSFQEVIGDEGSGSNEFIIKLRGQLKEIIKEILKSKMSESELAKDKYGLERLVRNYAKTLQHASNRNLNVKINIDPDSFFAGKAVNQAIYAIISEAMLNGVQYGDANILDVEVKKTVDSIEIRIKDNGTGFDVKDALGVYGEEGHDAWAGISGIFGRLEAIKSLFGAPVAEIKSNNNGTIISVVIPLLAEVEYE